MKSDKIGPVSAECNPPRDEVVEEEEKKLSTKQRVATETKSKGEAR